ncbi:hypothetical protein QBC47DRAFT_351913 [Echria macrotheca]|uniref:Galactose oxidase-like Early set domain-containing protein n=1 Tax=Echria macrotheca TaxID=438768 RepID=A0AAJ0B3W5_9PEZI|nr:hypothetical protein QBC47DRAFT_351913 [Echria macrotheca]
MVHATLLPNKKILYWGRREDSTLGETPPTQGPFDGDSENPGFKTWPRNLDERFTKTFVLDLATKESIPTSNEAPGVTAQTSAGIPKENVPSVGLQTVNLFCGGHTLLPDGQVIIFGGHIKDGNGEKRTCVYDWKTNQFTPKLDMNRGRWYPSALTLGDGRVIVLSGQGGPDGQNQIPQIWPADNGTAQPTAWVELQQQFFPNYPRVHLTPKGQLVVVGPNPETMVLDLKDLPSKDVDVKTLPGKVLGAWTNPGNPGIRRTTGFRDYCPSVMYDAGKIMYLGGGISDNEKPSLEVEFLDVNNDDKTKWAWTKDPLSNMLNPRRQFNATILADGTVLVTGGTQREGFNNLKKGGPVHVAELWDPRVDIKTGQRSWKAMNEESFDRCYHGTALLLPDATVLSAGGGEYGDAHPKDCLRNAQIFSPPYLFKGSRPVITKCPDQVVYDQTFTVEVGPPNQTIDAVTFIRLGSVTHCRNMSQSFLSLTKTQTGQQITVKAPKDGNAAAPGHYMLFVLSNGVPSIASIVRIATNPTPTIPPTPPPSVQPTPREMSASIASEQNRPPVVLGITPICPYGLGVCWGGAYSALNSIDAIEVVDPLPSQEDSLAYIYLRDREGLPDIDLLREEFARYLNRSYEIRGVEVTIEGGVVERAERTLVMEGTGKRPEVVLAPFGEGSNLRWDVGSKQRKPVSEEETGAYERLVGALAGEKGKTVRVTGTLNRGEGGFELNVREFEVQGTAA